MFLPLAAQPSSSTADGQHFPRGPGFPSPAPQLKEEMSLCFFPLGCEGPQDKLFDSTFEQSILSVFYLKELPFSPPCPSSIRHMWHCLETILVLLLLS